jgi:hypothetical protein
VIWRNLEADYDQWLKLCSIGFLVNPNTLVAAGSTHFVSLGCRRVWVQQSGQQWGVMASCCL